MRFYNILGKQRFIMFVICFVAVHIFSSSFKAQGSGDLQSVLLLIDVSGSMTGAKIDSVKSATKRIIEMLLPCNTEFSILGYSGKKEKPIKYYLNFSTNASQLLLFVDSLSPEGNTPLGAALKTACFSFKNNKNPKSVKQTIILLCDGRSDDKIPEALNELKERNSLIHCECIGFDIEKDKKAEEQLKQIARETGGEYYTATDVSNVIKAFLKPGIKTIIHDIPVTVYKGSGKLDFKPVTGNVHKMLTSQNWIVDSIQVNVSVDLYVLAKMIADENMQDTLPKSIVFDNSKIISLFINNGTDADVNKKWIEGKYNFELNALTINIQNHYMKLIIKKIEQRSLVLCVNKYKDLANDMVETTEEICDCNNKMAVGKPYILIYFSQAGCNK